MSVYWIGEKINTTGYYADTIEHGEIFKRVWDRDSTPLYKFETRFGQTVYISELYTIGTIEQIIEDRAYAELTNFLYETLLTRIGMVNFLHSISLHTAQERSNGYTDGRERAQRDIREALGIEED